MVNRRTHTASLGVPDAACRNAEACSAESACISRRGLRGRSTRSAGFRTSFCHLAAWASADRKTAWVVAERARSNPRCASGVSHGPGSPSASVASLVLDCYVGVLTVAE